MAKSPSFKFYLAISMSLVYISTVNAIISGTNVKNAVVPSIVTIRSGGQFLGCGTLVTQKKVLTAASILSTDPDVNTMIVGAGQTVLNNANETTRRKVTGYKKHPEYVSGGCKFNIAVMFLIREIGTNGTEIPLCTASVAPTATQTIYGWGVSNVNNTYPAQNLAKADLKTYPTACTTQFPDSGPGTKCIYSNGKPAPCKGDTGDPVISSNALVGVVSKGISCLGTDPYCIVDVCDATVKTWIETTEPVA